MLPFGEVAAGKGDPFVVHLEEDGGHQPFQRGLVVKDLDDVGAVFDG